MTNKDKELKLAQDLRALADRFSEGWHEGIKIDALDIELLANAAEALAEQPVIQQGWDVDDLLDKPKQPAQQQEPDYHICPTCGGMAFDPIVPSADRFASKPWVGLTDEEIEQCMKQAYATVQGRNLEHAFARAIEAKLREKNA